MDIFDAVRYYYQLNLVTPHFFTVSLVVLGISPSILLPWTSSLPSDLPSVLILLYQLQAAPGKTIVPSTPAPMEGSASPTGRTTHVNAT